MLLPMLAQILQKVKVDLALVTSLFTAWTFTQCCSCLHNLLLSVHFMFLPFQPTQHVARFAVDLSLGFKQKRQ